MSGIFEAFMGLLISAIVLAIGLFFTAIYVFYGPAFIINHIPNIGGIYFTTTDSRTILIIEGYNNWPIWAGVAIVWWAALFVPMRFMWRKIGAILYELVGEAFD